MVSEEKRRATVRITAGKDKEKIDRGRFHLARLPHADGL